MANSLLSSFRLLSLILNVLFTESVLAMDHQYSMYLMSLSSDCARDLILPGHVVLVGLGVIPLQLVLAHQHRRLCGFLFSATLRYFRCALIP